MHTMGKDSEKIAEEKRKKARNNINGKDLDFSDKFLESHHRLKEEISERIKKELPPQPSLIDFRDFGGVERRLALKRGIVKWMFVSGFLDPIFFKAGKT